jgi:hypothetical protein
MLVRQREIVAVRSQCEKCHGHCAIDLTCFAAGVTQIVAHCHRSQARDEASRVAHLAAEKTYDGGRLNKSFMSAKSILKTAEPSSSHIIVQQSYLMFVPRRCSWRISCCETM